MSANNTPSETKTLITFDDNNSSDGRPEVSKRSKRPSQTAKIWARAQQRRWHPLRGDRQQRAFQGSSSKTLWREDHQLFAHHGDSVHPRVRRGHFGGLNAAKPPQPLLSAREQQTAGARRDAPYR